MFFVWRVFDTVLQEYVEVVNDGPPTVSPDGNPIDTSLTVIADDTNTQSILRGTAGLTAVIQENENQPWAGVNTDFWRIIAGFTYEGTSVWAPTLMQVVMFSSVSTTFQYDVRLWDFTNDQTVAQLGFTAVTDLPETFEQNVFTNLPLNRTSIEIQARRSLAGTPDAEGRVQFVKLLP